jgi:hypothetical protein
MLTVKQRETQDIRARLFKLARDIHGFDIRPCGSAFTHEEKRGILFWYDTPDGSTHMVHEKMLTQA